MWFHPWHRVEAHAQNICDCPCFCKKPLGDNAKTYRVEHWRGKQLLETDLRVCGPCYDDLTSEPWSLLGETAGRT